MFEEALWQSLAHSISAWWKHAVPAYKCIRMLRVCSDRFTKAITQINNGLESYALSQPYVDYVACGHLYILRTPKVRLCITSNNIAMMSIDLGTCKPHAISVHGFSLRRAVS